jgi:hypothetical protein
MPTIDRYLEIYHQSISEFLGHRLCKRSNLRLVGLKY